MGRKPGGLWAKVKSENSFNGENQIRVPCEAGV